MYSLMYNIYFAFEGCSKKEHPPGSYEFILTFSRLGFWANIIFIRCVNIFHICLNIMLKFIYLIGWK